MDAVRRCLARLIAASAGLLAVLVVAAPNTARADLGMTGEAHAAVLDGIRTSLDATVRSYADRGSASDPRYFANGLWVNGDLSCWTCAMGASVGAAALVGERPDLLPVVVTSVDRAIRDRQRANGAFHGTGGADAVQTGWFVPMVGTIYLTIGDRLDATTRARWVASIAAAADWLVAGREPFRYVNGNTNLSYVHALWTAWRVSGELRFWTAYLAAWSRVTAGLRLTTTPTEADGSDGVGYLPEAGGFDPFYAQMQLDALAAFYAMSREPLALRLMNLLANGVLARVNAASTLDARFGSRRSLLTPFLTPAVSVLVASGQRPDLAPRFTAQAARITDEYTSATTATQPDFYRGVGTWLAVPVLEARPLPSLPVIPAPAKPAPVAPSPVNPAPAPPASPVTAPPKGAPAPAAQPRASDAASPRASSVTVRSRARVRTGALRVAVEAPVGATVRAALLCGSAKCGASRATRVADSATVTLRVRLASNLTRSVRRTGRRVATAVITVRSGGRTHTEHRSVWFYR